LRRNKEKFEEKFLKITSKKVKELKIMTRVKKKRAMSPSSLSKDLLSINSKRRTTQYSKEMIY